MVQPAPPRGFSRLETLYTQALRLLGVVSPGNVALDTPNIITNVQVLADVSDVTIPHQNPLFGYSSSDTPAAGENQLYVIGATSRPLRIWTIFVGAGTGVRIVVLDEDLRANTIVAQQVSSLGPVGTAAAATAAGNTAIVGRGTTTGVVAPFTTLASFEPELVQWNANKFLIAPGQFFTLYNTIVAEAANVKVIFEEIPDQNEVTGLGFPTAP